MSFLGFSFFLKVNIIPAIPQIRYSKNSKKHNSVILIHRTNQLDADRRIGRQ